jgi:geranylgeranyl reductase family protein
MSENRYTQRADVVIVGGGPAGAMTALSLVPKGLTVLIIEAAALPRYKSCGGALVARAAALIPKSIAIPWERQSLTAEMVVHDLGLRFVAKAGAPLAATVMRSTFDHALVKAAEAQGAVLWSPCRVRGIRHRGGHVEVETERGYVRAGFVIAADGATGTTARHAGWTQPLFTVPALAWEVEVDQPTLERFGRSLRFDLGYVPDGYAWVFPKLRHLSVGLLRTRRGRAPLKALLSRYLTTLGITQPREIERHGFVVPQRPHDEPLVRGRVLLVGDAAGIADPLVSEGLSHALMSGAFAAQAILEGAFDPWRVEFSYEARMRPTILAELPYARFAARLLYRMPAARTWLFERHGQTICDAVADLFAGQRTYRSLFLSPHAYMRLLTAPSRPRAAKTPDARA